MADKRVLERLVAAGEQKSDNDIIDLTGRSILSMVCQQRRPTHPICPPSRNLFSEWSTPCPPKPSCSPHKPAKLLWRKTKLLQPLAQLLQLPAKLPLECSSCFNLQRALRGSFPLHCRGSLGVVVVVVVVTVVATVVLC